MAITKQKQLFYFVDGKPYASLEEAQLVDLEALIPGEVKTTPEVGKLLAAWMLKNSDAIVATLTTTTRSRARKPRADKGVPRKKKPQESSPKG
jgi:hypothetical protein